MGENEICIVICYVENDRADIWRTQLYMYKYVTVGRFWHAVKLAFYEYLTRRSSYQSKAVVKFESKTFPHNRLEKCTEQ